MTPFDEDFKDTVLAFCLRDKLFFQRTEGLIKKEFFESEVNSYLFGLVDSYFSKYDNVPSPVVLSRLLKEDIDNKVIRKDLKNLILTKVKSSYSKTLSDRDFFIDRIAEFARKTACKLAILQVADLLDKGGDENKIPQIMQSAVDVGASDLVLSYDFVDNIDVRANIRQARLSGELSFNSVTTGYELLDNVLYRKGWGKGELSAYMGPAKSGKSPALMEHAIRAAQAGFKVLHISLELCTEINSDRMESNISGVPMDKIYENASVVRESMHQWAKQYNPVLKMHEYPTGSFRPSDLKRLLNKYKSTGLYFDLVVLDYADIMGNDSGDDEISRSKNNWISLRGIAQQENIALLTATQTNRAGAKAERVEATDVAEDYNKVRIADILITISANETEIEHNEARIYLAASRNQQSSELRVARDLSRMRHIVKIIDIN